MNMERIPKQGEIYRHFKNKLYQIVAIAEHTENQEKLVVYQALYGDFAVYARPLDLFIGKVDRKKYPQVKQMYRFELVSAEELEKMKRAEKGGPDAEESGNDNEKAASGSQTAGSPEKQPEVSKKLMEFLDAGTMEKKYNILVSMRDEITDQMIDNMAVVVDVVIPEGELYDRYDALKNAIHTRQKYEYANRLR